jgi:hypothetical protein
MPITLSHPFLTTLLIALVLASACTEAFAAGKETQAEAITRCFALRRSEPEAALVLARSILATPGLPV